MGTTYIDIQTIIEFKSNMYDTSKVVEKQLKLPLSAGESTKKRDKDISGHLVLKCEIPPMENLKQAAVSSSILVRGVSGNEIIKVAKSSKVDTWHKLPPFEYEANNEFNTISTINALWFSKLSQLAYKSKPIIEKVATSLLGFSLLSFSSLLAHHANFLQKKWNNAERS